MARRNIFSGWRGINRIGDVAREAHIDEVGDVVASHFVVQRVCLETKDPGGPSLVAAGHFQHTRISNAIPQT